MTDDVVSTVSKLDDTETEVEEVGDSPEKVMVVLLSVSSVE